jgi:hypothetical protein
MHAVNRRWSVTFVFGVAPALVWTSPAMRSSAQPEQLHQEMHRLILRRYGCLSVPKARSAHAT